MFDCPVGYFIVWGIFILCKKSLKSFLLPFCAIPSFWLCTFFKCFLSWRPESNFNLHKEHSRLCCSASLHICRANFDWDGALKSQVGQLKGFLSKMDQTRKVDLDNLNLDNLNLATVAAWPFAFRYSKTLALNSFPDFRPISGDFFISLCLLLMCLSSSVGKAKHFPHWLHSFCCLAVFSHLCSDAYGTFISSATLRTAPPCRTFWTALSLSFFCYLNLWTTLHWRLEWLTRWIFKLFLVWYCPPQVGHM